MCEKREKAEKDRGGEMGFRELRKDREDRGVGGSRGRVLEWR